MTKPVQRRHGEPPQPFLKWAGGKRQLLPELDPRVALARPFNRYHEPFIGGGALFFHLVRSNGLGQNTAFLSDNNGRLIDAYLGIRDVVDEVVRLLQEHANAHCSEHYYAMRACVPETPAERAARVIYLNRTCFNGLFRENSAGVFNVPIGRYRNPCICDEENLRAVSASLKRAQIEVRPFETVLERAGYGDFVYFDPPYHPVSKTASFTAYAKEDFGEENQRHLAAVFCELTLRGIKSLLSNSDTPLIHTLYDGFKIERVAAARAINSRASGRGKIQEVLVRNF